MAFIAAAVIAGGAAIIGGITQSRSADKAADAQTAASDQASKTQLEMYYQSREDTAPWRIAGENALAKLMGGSTYRLPAPQKEDFMRRTSTPGAPASVSISSKPAAPTHTTTGYGVFDGVVKKIPKPSFAGSGMSAEDYAMKYGEQLIAAQQPGFISGSTPEKTLAKYIETADYTEGTGPTRTESFDQKAYDKAYKNYLESGTETIGMIEAGPGEFVPEEDPGYKFGYEESVEKPLLRGAAATGRLDDGRTMKELTRYASDYASTKYDNFLSRYYDSLKPWQSMAGIGQTTASQNSQNALVTGQSIAQNQVAAGDARASGYINQGNVWGNVASGLGQNALDYYYMNQYGGTPQTPQINYGGR